MTERIKFEVDDAELEAVIARIDEAILKKVELITRTPRVAPIAPKISATEGDVEATIERLSSELIDLENTAAMVEVNAEVMLERVGAEIIAVDQAVTTVSQDALMTLFEVEMRTRTLSDRVRDLPQVDRATRMILLRIPGVRQVLQLLYIIKMEERTLRLGQIAAEVTAADIKIAMTTAELMVELKAVEAEAIAVETATRATLVRVAAEIQAAETQAAASIGSIRGPVTAAITLLLYAIMANQWLQRRQDRIEARMAALEREVDRRHITLEESVRGYGMLPEKYRSTIPP